jgi:XTP/dITP diphosphohydrolase
LKELVVATQNKHKVEEFQRLLEPAGFYVKGADIELDVPEDGLTFRDNALIKAKAFYQQLKKPVLADDSGLVLNAYPEILGVQSARYAPELDDYKDKCEKLLKLYEEQVDRKAYFVCYLCFYLSDSQVFYFEGRCYGEISTTYNGSGGFGYDPIFIPQGQSLSFAQDTEYKDAHSHRAKACEHAVQFLADF